MIEIGSNLQDAVELGMLFGCLLGAIILSTKMFK